MATKTTKAAKTDSITQSTEDLITVSVSLASEVHKKIGTGKPLVTYGSSLEAGLKNSGYKAAKQMKHSIIADGNDTIEYSTVEILVDDRLVIDVIAVDRLLPAYERQLLSYLEAGGYKRGLIINFEEANINDGIIRVIN